MRICVVGRVDLTSHPATRMLARRLAGVGHETILVTGDHKGDEGEALRGIDVVTVPRRVPKGGGRIGALLRSAQPRGLARRLLDRRLAREVRRLRPDVVYPAGPTDVATARSAVAGTDGVVSTAPHWPDAAATDLAWIAPHRPALMQSPSGPGLPLEVSPSAGGSRRVAVAYRRTRSSPGRYLEAALRREGHTVIEVDEVIDWESLGGVDALLVVESLLPRIESFGVNPGIPVLYWVHHGEHHLAANLRLARHYQADAVLLAHSWHLAHWFGVPVHAFPFGIPSELTGPWAPFAERDVDVALIGSGVDALGGRYRRRAELVAAAKRSTERVTAERGLSPEELFDLYRRSKIVLNDGGDRHLPITMRVMEAIGSGALLLTDDAPGLDVLFTPGEHYRLVEQEPERAIRAALADPGSEDVAHSGYRHGHEHHTYDHRVRRLMAIIQSTARRSHDAPYRSELEIVLDRDADVEFVAGAVTGLADHVIDPRPLDEVPADGVDAVVVDNPAQVEQALRAARLFVYGPESVLQGGALVAKGMVRVGAGGSSYRVAADA